ncbi:hypothetical protein V8C42DRAFT_327474 [Trichoderma barbatum]
MWLANSSTMGTHTHVKNAPLQIFLHDRMGNPVPGSSRTLFFSGPRNVLPVEEFVSYCLRMARFPW